MLGLSLAMTLGNPTINAGGFSLGAFMAAQTDGFSFDTSVISSTWQDTSATVPADDIGEAIGRINDLRVGAGSPHNGLQASAPLKPVRQATGAKYDGSDDYSATDYVAGVGANFIVTLVDVPASIAAVQVFAGVNGGANDRFFVGVDTAGLIVGGVGAQSVTVIKGATDRRGQQVVVGLSCDGTTVRLFGDNALIYEGAQSGNPNTSLGIWVGATNISGASGNRFSGAVKKINVGRTFLDLTTYRNIRNKLLA